MPISITDHIRQLSADVEIVGVLQKNDIPVTTLLVRPFTIDVDTIPDSHLGDKGTMKISYTINSIKFNQMSGGRNE